MKDWLHILQYLGILLICIDIAIFFKTKKRKSKWLEKYHGWMTFIFWVILFLGIFLFFLLPMEILTRSD